MTGKELIQHAKERKDVSSLCSLGAQESEIIEAVLELERTNYKFEMESVSLKNEISILKEELKKLESKQGEKDFEISKLEKQVKEKSWVAQELGKFVRDIGLGLYEGKEMAAANRVYELNNKEINRRWINANLYQNLDEAIEAFHKRKNTSIETIQEWLFERPEE